MDNLLNKWVKIQRAVVIAAIIEGRILPEFVFYFFRNVISICIFYFFLGFHQGSFYFAPGDSTRKTQLGI